jgi:tetrapyrrole methylase family protein/MazG family protein
VFGTVQADDTDQALNTWDAQKRTEKGQKTAADSLDGVSRALPALIRAEKIQDKARKAGFDWNETQRAVDKLSEEVEELKQAIQEQSNVQEELGDVLFAAAKVGRFVGVDPEQALHGTCEKFIRRFRSVEQQAQAEGAPMDQIPLPQLEQMWERAKHQET